MRRTAKVGFYTLIFVMFGLLGYWIPMAGDDYNWWSSWGQTYFQSGTFTYYDGRYLGDLLIILMMKLRIIGFLAYGTFSTAIVYLIQKIRDAVSPTKSFNLLAASISALFLLLVPKFIFQQTFGWHSGFANYIPSVVFPLFMFYLLVKNLDDTHSHYYRTQNLLIFFFALGAQFFAEHITILNCFNIVLIWLLFRHRFNAKFKRTLIYITIGNFLGALLMFINGAYLKIITGQAGSNSYRTLGQSGTTIISYLKNSVSLTHLVLLSIIMVLALIFVTIFTLRVKNEKQRIINFGLVLSAIITILPFLVVSPFGGRCLFAAYVFTITLISVNLDLLINSYRRYLLPVLTLIMIAFGLKIDNIAYNDSQTFDIATSYASYQLTNNSKSISLPTYESTDLIWASDPASDAMFKHYYLYDTTKKVTSINYKDFQKALQKTKSNPSSKKGTDFITTFDKQIKKIQ